MSFALYQIWLAAAIVLVIVEFMTASFGSICFAVGALAAMVVAFFCDSLYVQIAVMLLVSVIALFTIRPLVMKYLDRDHQATNMDRMKGRKARVTEVIDAHNYRVSIDGVDWRATTDDALQTGQEVVITATEGNTLHVEAME